MSKARELPSDHPLCQATWIWPGGQMYVYNQYAQFRKDFELPAVPGKAPLFLTADQAYRLYVNGRYVCRGPARGYQSHWPFDEVDVAKYLQSGHNWVAVLAYNPGISTFQYRFQGTAGFLCAAAWDGLTLVSDPSWAMRRMPGVRAFTARLSLQMAFQEHVDGSLADRSWIEEAHPALAWEDAPEKRTSWEAALPYGRPPYDTLEPRGIPLLKETLRAPTAVRCAASGPCGEGYRTWENVSWGWLTEAESTKTWQDGSDIPHGVVDGAMEFEVPPTGEGNYAAVTLDAGEYLVGTLMVEAQGARGGEILDTQHHENLVHGRPAIRPQGIACLIALANRLVLRAGTTRHEFFHPLGFHYVTLIVRDSLQPIRLRVRIRQVGYPFAMKGAFACSDGLLNEIHGICRRTQQICAQDAYMDTPWREQAQWWGDARVQARNTFYLDGDARLLARGIRSIAGQSTLQGLTYGHAPTVAYNCVLPDFSLTWILTLWDYYWQTGEADLFVEQWPRVKEVLGYFDTHAARSEQGLLGHDRRFWYFGDWADLYRGHVPTLLNLWYLLTLRRLTDLLGAAAMDAPRRVMVRKAARHERLVARWLYDPRRQLFCGGLDESGKQVQSESVHDQVVAMMLNLAPEAHPGMMDRFVLPYLAGEPLDAAVPSAFWCTYLLEHAGRSGYAAEAIAFIRRKWSPMLETGTTWEDFNWAEGSGGSASHAWSAHPSYHLVNLLVGVRQAAPAWSRVEFAPAFPPEISHASAVVPSPKGEIRAAWELRNGVVQARLSLPPQVTAEVSLPGVHQECPGGQEHLFQLKL